jgi:hypothetical protein
MPWREKKAVFRVIKHFYPSFLSKNGLQISNFEEIIVCKIKH